MKKFIAILALALTATTAMAQHHYGYGHHHNGYYRGYYGGGGWVAPLIIGGAVGYALSRPAPVVVEQPPVVVPQTPVVIQQPQCARYTRYIYQDQSGQVIREEIRCD
jgi:hypothetical protein